MSTLDEEYEKSPPLDAANEGDGETWDDSSSFEDDGEPIYCDLCDTDAVCVAYTGDGHVINLCQQCADAFKLGQAYPEAELEVL